MAAQVRGYEARLRARARSLRRARSVPLPPPPSSTAVPLRRSRGRLRRVGRQAASNRLLDVGRDVGRSTLARSRSSSQALDDCYDRVPPEGGLSVAHSKMIAPAEDVGGRACAPRVGQAARATCHRPCRGGRPRSDGRIEQDLSGTKCFPRGRGSAMSGSPASRVLRRVKRTFSGLQVAGGLSRSRGRPRSRRG